MSQIPICVCICCNPWCKWTTHPWIFIFKCNWEKKVGTLFQHQRSKMPLKLLLSSAVAALRWIAFYENLYDPNGKLLRIIVIIMGRQRPILNYYFYMDRWETLKVPSVLELAKINEIFECSKRQALSHGRKFAAVGSGRWIRARTMLEFGGPRRAQHTLNTTLRSKSVEWRN